jgi:hypothetical protein
VEEKPTPGMWVTQNLLSHQNEYRVMHIHNIDKDGQVHYDLTFSFSKYSGSDTLYGKYSWDPSGTRLFAMPRYVFNKQAFQVMKKPRPDIRRAMMITLIEGKRGASI